MRQQSRRNGQLSDGYRTEVAQRIIDWLASRYRSKVAENVAADTGIRVETVQKMVDRVSMPSAYNLMRLAAAYGPEFLADVYPTHLGWLSEAARQSKQARLNAEIDRLRAELERS